MLGRIVEVLVVELGRVFVDVGVVWWGGYGFV